MYPERAIVALRSAKVMARARINVTVFDAVIACLGIEYMEGLSEDKWKGCPTLQKHERPVFLLQ